MLLPLAFKAGQLAAGATHIAHNGDADERCAKAAARDAGDTELHQGGDLGHSALCERSDAGAGTAAATAQPLDESQFEVGNGSGTKQIE